MTMIFYSNVADDLVQDSFILLTTMIVYRGKQPTVAEYITKVNNGTYTCTGNYLLQIYKDVDLSKSKVESVTKIEKNSPDGTSYGNYFCQAGLAEWAVLFDKTTSQGTNKLLNFNTSPMTFTRNISENDLFMIVPVSDIKGVGVLRFDSIDFKSGNNPNPIKRFAVNFS
jgi:hypothetical protein